MSISILLLLAEEHFWDKYNLIRERVTFLPRYDTLTQAHSSESSNYPEESLLDRYYSRQYPLPLRQREIHILVFRFEKTAPQRSDRGDQVHCAFGK